MAEKRTVVSEEKKGFSLEDLIIVAVLLAAGAVLKLVVGSVVNFFGMKPNFVIAAYCLAILLTRPKLYQCAIIGLLAGAICQFLPGTPWLNLISELVGAFAPDCAVLEEPFVGRNSKTAIILGMARGAILAALEEVGYQGRFLYELRSGYSYEQIAENYRKMMA